MGNIETAGATATVTPGNSVAAKPQGGILDSFAIADTVKTEIFGEQTEGAPETTETEPKGEADVVGDDEATSLTEKTEEGEPVVTPKAEEQPLLAGRFKTAQELENAYDASSKEARRLHSETVSLHKANAELQDKMDQLELEKELGSFYQLTDEQLESLMASEDPKDRLQAQRYIVEERSFKDKKSSLERDQKRSKAGLAERQEKVKTEISQNMESMKNDSKEFPNFTQYIPLMNQIFDKFGGTLGGHPLAAEAIYLIAHGITSRQTAQQASKATQADKDKAKEAALTNARAAGSSGASHAGKAPASNVSTEDMDDKAFMEKMLNSRPRGLFEKV